MFVIDDVLPDPHGYRTAVLSRPFGPIHISDEMVFHGIQLATDPMLPMWIKGRWPGLTPMLSFYRKSPAGQREPNYIHTDRDMGDWTAILYLNPKPLPGDGTMFWRHRATGAEDSTVLDPDAIQAEQLAWRDAQQWECVGVVDAKFGRLLVFPAAAFHSRAILDNYGTGDDARLIQVVFGTGQLPPNPQ